MSNQQLFTIERMAELCNVPDYRVRYLLQRFEVPPDATLPDGDGYRRGVLDWIQAEIQSIKDTPERRENERRAWEAYLQSGDPADAGDPEMSDELRDDLLADSLRGVDENRARWAKWLTPPAPAKVPSPSPLRCS